MSNLVDKNGNVIQPHDYYKPASTYVYTEDFVILYCKPCDTEHQVMCGETECPKCGTEMQECAE